MTRRQVLAAPVAAAAFSAGAQTSPRFVKGICSVIFPRETPRAECFKLAKSAGFDVKVIRQLIRIRKQEPAEVEEQETLLDVYRRALGM